MPLGIYNELSIDFLADHDHWLLLPISKVEGTSPCISLSLTVLFFWLNWQTVVIFLEDILGYIV